VLTISLRLRDTWHNPTDQWERHLSACGQICPFIRGPREQSESNAHANASAILNLHVDGIRSTRGLRYWRQSDVRELVAYARDRGVRLVPEIELPQHARSLLPLTKRGLRFCNASFPVMLYDDLQGETAAVLERVIAEVASVFIDDVVHLGMDEAQCHYSDPSAHDPLQVGCCGIGVNQLCNASTVRSLESKILRFVSGTLHKRPSAWQNALFDCGDLNGCDAPGSTPATDGMPETIVEVYTGDSAEDAAHLAANATARGFLTTQANAARLYLDTGSTDPASYRKALWYDINEGVITNPEQLARLLGGSMSLW
jgi:hypothetical protein